MKTTEIIDFEHLKNFPKQHKSGRNKSSIDTLKGSDANLTI